MAGFSSFNQLKTALLNGQILIQSFEILGVSGYPAGFSATVGTWYQQVRPGVGADPSGTPGTSYSNATGGINFPDASNKYLLDWNVVSAQTSAMGLILVDRLVGVGAISINTTGDKTINSTALPRYTSGENVMVFLEVQTAGTTTAPIVSLSSYTNESGATTHSGATITFPSTTYPKGGLIGPMPLAATDRGVRSVETINVATAGGGSAAVNVLLVKQLTSMQLDGARDRWSDKLWPLPNTHMVRIYDGATLAIFSKNISNSITPIFGTITVVEG